VSLDDDERRALYDRADRSFAAGVLLKPVAVSADETETDLAPLLLQQADPSEFGAKRPERVVSVLSGTVKIGTTSYEQRTYLWSHPALSTGDRPVAQGVRMTLGSDGFPAIYEVLTDSSGARPIFVTTVLEDAASAEFGDPLEGRRFAIERAVEDAPDVIVPGILEPGPTPLGPFVYLTEPAHDVATLICRCMPSQVEVILDSLEYRLEPVGDHDPSEIAKEALSLDQSLRLPSSAL
jgi:hypothetical protein